MRIVSSAISECVYTCASVCTSSSVGRSAVSGSLPPRGLCLCPPGSAVCGSPGRNTGVGCRALEWVLCNQHSGAVQRPYLELCLSTPHSTLRGSSLWAGEDGVMVGGKMVLIVMLFHFSFLFFSFIVSHLLKIPFQKLK